MMCLEENIIFKNKETEMSNQELKISCAGEKQKEDYFLKYFLQ